MMAIMFMSWFPCDFVTRDIALRMMVSVTIENSFLYVGVYLFICLFISLQLFQTSFFFVCAVLIIVISYKGKSFYKKKLVKC